MGPKGSIVGRRLILGLVLLEPNYVYPEHSHDQIEESYLVLSGKVAVKQSGVFDQKV